MNVALAVAMDKLPALREIPTVAQVERQKLEDGKPFSWGGSTKDGSWELIKLGANEFKVTIVNKD